MHGNIRSQNDLTGYPLAKCPARLEPATDSENAFNDGRDDAHLGALYGASLPMQRLFERIACLDRSSAPVIILGESGSGKELVAATLHQRSPRRDRAMVAVNCGAIPENLIESELFGHERGSFTGASRRHHGFFERAHGGTLFLDEVTEMPVEMQVRLLRVLETGHLHRIGGDTEIAVDTRILASTNRDLREAVASGRLREDLMYRLCVIPITLPPLRERGDDVLLLAQRFLADLNHEYGCRKSLSDLARRRVLGYGWPGNVRELKNVVQRGFVLSGDTIDVDPASGPSPSPMRPASSVASVGALRSVGGPRVLSVPIGTSLAEVERAVIGATLQSVSGSRSKAAQLLGVSVKTLYNRLQRYGKEAGPAAAQRASKREALAA